MFETINETSVVAVSLLALAIGSIWYSPYLFGEVWQKVAGLTSETLSYAKSEFLRLLIGVLVANMLVFGVIAHVLTVVPRSTLSLTELAVGLMLFVGAVLFSMVLWEKRSFTYGCIHVGYAIVVIGVGVGVLQYWPW